MLIVSDLHLGKSERMARRRGALLPPYETTETLNRLADDLSLTGAETVLCLGDSFDDLQASESISPSCRDAIYAMQDGRRWIWIEGNHDSGATRFGGTHVAEHREENLTFRHIALGDGHVTGEVSGHYHPKARVRSASRPCFIADSRRLICPAYGTYTGGLDWMTPVLRDLFDDRAWAWLTGRKVIQVPVPVAA